MRLKELLKVKINNNYKEIATILCTSEWGAKEIINGNGETTIDALDNLFKHLGIAFVELEKRNQKYELSTEVNNKIFRNYAAYWLEKKKYEVRESTFANYCNQFKNNILPCLGDIPCENFNNKLIQNFCYWCKEQGGINKTGISEHYIKDCLTIVKAVIRDGQEEKVFPDFIIKQIKIPKTYLIEDKKQIYTEEDYKKIIKYILDNISNKSIGILIGIYTGMRIGEICALKFKDIDIFEKTIHVNKTIQRIYNPYNDIEPSKIVITPGKTKNSIRDVPITPEIAEILKTLITNENDYVLTGSKKPIEPRTYRKFYNTFMKKAGVEPIKFHALRHTFASINIENGTDVKTISEILGHSNISITLQNYTHISQKAKEKAIDKFNKMFQNQAEKIEFTNKYKGNICCINKRTTKCDFIGTIKEVGEYLAETTKYICDVINGISDDECYDIVPKIIGITHDKYGNYVGGIN